jgi:hypothetical protein
MGFFLIDLKNDIITNEEYNICVDAWNGQQHKNVQLFF